VPQPNPAGDGGSGPNGTGEQSPIMVTPPHPALPKGSGAIRGIDEKFAANPATGGGSLTVPIASSQGRSGFGPKLGLEYDSGSGNGPFGFGWSLRLPAITRKTANGLPRYDDAGESDVFLISGAEDLVPVLDLDLSRSEDRSTAPGYLIHRYRPRVESAFARIERWTRLGDGDVHWRSLSRDNVLTTYGGTAQSRIADPTDPRRVFSWLICETRDDLGNAVRYEYKAEDGSGVDLGAAHERNRGPRDDPRRAVNRYLKRIRYGNRQPLLDDAGQRPRFLSETRLRAAGWLFEVVFDYGEHDQVTPGEEEVAPWVYRPDAFSDYRAGFEVRTARRCRRVLMLHHFPDEPDVGADCLVRSTDFRYADELDPTDPTAPTYSVLRTVTGCGYRRDGAGYLRRSLPPVEFEYSAPVIQATVREVDLASADLPPGRPSNASRWIDLHGDGAAGLLSQLAGAWYYRRNLSPAAGGAAELGARERVAATPSVAVADGRVQFTDVTGDGTLDIVLADGPAPGYHEHDDADGWREFRPFPARLGRDLQDPNVRLVDLDGDGWADVLVTEDEALLWHPSLGRDGFGPAYRVPAARDEDSGPRLVFADPEQSVLLADMTGDGQADLVRVRNGEICYWPNLGYGRFGAKVSMDRSPHLDLPDQFDQRRVRLADVDGSGPTDLLYLAGDGVRAYFNQCGNSWSAPQVVPAFPIVDDPSTVEVADLLGTGTACLVWSSRLPRDTERPLRYVDLMGGQKPHLLVRSVNNRGAETIIGYAPSTRFSTADRLAGRPWSTRLPFPVHVVERVETVDRISGNRFVTRYAYHDGHFDGVEREFRGFGLVEQWDTEEIAALAGEPAAAPATNFGTSSQVPPVLTRTWFHTGAEQTGDPTGYYREPDAGDQATLLPDTALPAGLTLAEQREAYRALAGTMLRQETYALDGTDRQPHPYRVTEQNATVRLLQPQAGTRHAVFVSHPRESIVYQYERNPADPRVAHTLTLEVDDYGNVLRSVQAGYGRREPDPTLSAADQARQAQRLLTCTEQTYTNPVELPEVYRAPLPCESRRYELVDPAQSGPRLDFEATRSAVLAAEPLEYQEEFSPGRTQKRLIAHVRTRYRPDDLGAARGDPLALLAAGVLESRAFTGETLTLAFTAGLVAERYADEVTDAMLVTDAVLATDGGYVHSDGDPHWWAGGGRVFLSPDRGDDPAGELSFAQRHFFLPHRFRDPFDRAGFETESVVAYDAYQLSPRTVRDAVGNTNTVEVDYRVLLPYRSTDPNGNRAEVAFDALGMVVGTAVMGKENTAEGDSLAGFPTDLDDAEILAHLADPLADPHAILQRASTRVVYDAFAYLRSQDQPQPQPAVAYTLARETHDADLADGELPGIRHTFGYFDGFGREIQQKIQAEGGRWICSGWTVFDNKGQPVRRYEPFFTDIHRFEFDPRHGVSPILCYDPVGRVVATVHPDHIWQKVAFDAWRQETWDPGDTVLAADPAADPDVGGAISRLPAGEYLPTWHAQRAGGALGPDERAAALAAEVYADTPTVAHLDPLGRAFLTVAHNRLVPAGGRPGDPPEDSFQRSVVALDIAGNPLAMIDALDRTVMRYDYDLLGRQVYEISMDAGQRWTLRDITGKPVRAFDSRGHTFRTEYDVLRRPVRRFVSGSDAVESDPRVLGRDVLVEQTVYGEGRAGEYDLNLRGQVRAVHDAAGVVTYDAYDFKGNLLGSTRRLATDDVGVPDWAGPVALEEFGYTGATSYDALNRVTASTSPDGSVVRPAWNEAGLLERVDADIQGETRDGQPVWTPVIDGIDYDATSRRTGIRYANGAVTTYDYDPLTFRLVRLRTAAGGDQVQELAYTYDPVGNITHVQDDAQQTIFFRNRRVEPSNGYRYDPTYRLIEATGREHLGQSGGGVNPPTPPDAFDSVHIGLPHPGDGNAMGTYRESYDYDPVGNILRVRHVGSDPANPGWTRTYDYREPSLIEPAAVNNRLSATRVGSGLPEPYRYDAHGGVTGMPHLTAMLWNFLDQVRATSRQVVNTGTPETTFYSYDAAGQRVRKATHRDGDATRQRERVYLGGFEIYREYATDGRTVALERQTLHVMDGQQRVAMVESRTVGDDGSPSRLIRYHLTNHLGSSTVELDETGRPISYEEYHPYGATSYQAADPAVLAAAKRYRYTGKERDEETGFGYHGARYYAPWLGRWTSADPAGLVDGVNRYAYARGAPVGATDPDGTQSSDWHVGFYVEQAREWVTETWNDTVESGRQSARDWLIGNSPFAGVVEATQDVVDRNIAGNTDYYVDKSMEGTWSHISNVASLIGAGIQLPEIPAARLATVDGPALRAEVTGLKATAASATAKTISFDSFTTALRTEGTQVAEHALEFAGPPQPWTSARALEQVTGRTAEVNNRAISAVIKEELAPIPGVRPGMRLTYNPQYSPYARTGLAMQGEGTQIGKNVFTSRFELLDTIIHEELHHRWFDRGIPGGQHHPLDSPQEQLFYAIIARYKDMRGWTSPRGPVSYPAKGSLP
jgi:RHS repeat-associated protein